MKDSFGKALVRTAQVALVIIILIVGLSIGYVASSQVPAKTLTITSNVVSTATQVVVEESTIMSTTTFTRIITNTSQIQALDQKISNLTNSSALKQLEISLLEQTGKLAVNVYYINQTWTVPAHSNYSLFTQSAGNNGTLYFFISTCPSYGTSGIITSNQYNLYVVMNSSDTRLFP